MQGVGRYYVQICGGKRPKKRIRVFLGLVGIGRAEEKHKVVWVFIDFMNSIFLFLENKIGVSYRIRIIW